MHLCYVWNYEFPFHQGRFQGGSDISPDADLSKRFHSTKEGFKVKFRKI